MDAALFARYHSAPQGPLKRKLEGQLVQENQWLVIKFVDRALFYSKVFVEREDANQCGMIALVTALRRFDPSKGFKLSTFLAWWVKKEIGNFLLLQTPIYRPQSVGIPWRVEKKREELEGKSPNAITAEDLGITEQELQKYLSVAFRYTAIDGDDTTKRHVHGIASDDPGAEALLQERDQENLITWMLSEMTEEERRAVIDGDKKVSNYQEVRERFLDWARGMMDVY